MVKLPNTKAITDLIEQTYTKVANWYIQKVDKSIVTKIIDGVKSKVSVVPDKIPNKYT